MLLQLGKLRLGSRKLTLRFGKGGIQGIFLLFRPGYTLIEIFQRRFGPLQVLPGTLHVCFGLRDGGGVVFCRLGLLIFLLLPGSRILGPSVLDGELLLLHFLFLGGDGLGQIVLFQGKQHVPLADLLAFSHQHIFHPEARYGGHRHILILLGLSGDGDGVVDGSAGRLLNGHHGGALLVNGSGQQGEHNHSPKEDAHPFPDAVLVFFQAHN